MKVHVIFLISCLCSSLAITIYNDKPENSNKSAKEYKTALKDIRYVPVAQTNEGKPEKKTETLEKPIQRSREDSKIRRYNPQNKKKSISRVGNSQNFQNDPNHQLYMQKMANQLYMAQKHASLLSDYQKFIVNQDENVKKFVLAQSIQERTPKPFSRQRQVARALPIQPKLKFTSPEPTTGGNADYKKIVVSPKIQTTPEIISRPQNDHSAQGTQIKYITLAPQSLTHFVENHEPSPKVTLAPYHIPQQYTYYDVGVTHKPQVETVQIPATVSLGLGAYETYKSEGEHTEDNLYHDTNYEFMYNVKDHERNNNFGHKESRTDKTTYGYYFVHLPDGRLETVKYWADKTGYHAKVDYQGEAKHPIHTENNFLHH